MWFILSSLFEQPFLQWLAEQRSIIAFSLAAMVFAATLILNYGFGVWWPWGFAMAALLGVVGLFASLFTERAE